MRALARRSSNWLSGMVDLVCTGQVGEFFQPNRSCRVEKFSIQPITSVEPNSTKLSWVGLDRQCCAYLFYALLKLSFHELFKHLYSIMYYEAYNFLKLYSKYIYISLKKYKFMYLMGCVGSDGLKISTQPTNPR